MTEEEIITCICRLLPNKVYVTVPVLDKTEKYIVVGIINLDRTYPSVVVKKNIPNSKATYNVPCNLIESIIVNDFKNGEDKD